MKKCAYPRFLSKEIPIGHSGRPFVTFIRPGSNCRDRRPNWHWQISPDFSTSESAAPAAITGTTFSIRFPWRGWKEEAAKAEMGLDLCQRIFKSRRRETNRGLILALLTNYWKAFKKRSFSSEFIWRRYLFNQMNSWCDICLYRHAHLCNCELVGREIGAHKPEPRFILPGALQSKSSLPRISVLCGERCKNCFCLLCRMLKFPLVFYSLKNGQENK